jgi:hypothetical protein
VPEDAYDVARIMNFNSSAFLIILYGKYVSEVSEIHAV